MALRLRRGTDAERLTVVFPSGEPVWTLPDPNDPNDPEGNKLYVGDGTTVGGKLVGPFDVESDTDPKLSADLNLNGNNIIGSGNIDIDGTITATGDITLGQNTGQIVFSSGVTLTAGEVIIQSDAEGNETARGTVQTGVANLNIVPMKPMSASWGIGGTYTNIGSITGALPSIDSFTVAEDTVSIPGIINTGLRPGFDGEFDLGSTSRNWRNIYAKGAEFEGEIKAGTLSVDYIIGSDSAVIYDSTTETISANVFGNIEGNLLSADSTVIVDHLNRTINASDITCDGLILNNIPVTSEPGSSQIIFGDLNDPTEIIINSDAAGLGINVIGETSAFGGDAPIMSVTTHRGTVDVPETVQVGDGIGGILLRSHDGSVYQNTAIISGDVVDTSGPNIDVKLLFATFNGLNNNDIVEINSNGRLSAKQVKTGSFATASLPATPDAGTIVFDSDTNEFKGWNGSAWVVLG